MKPLEADYGDAAREQVALALLRYRPGEVTKKGLGNTLIHSPSARSL